MHCEHFIMGGVGYLTLVSVLHFSIMIPATIALQSTHFLEDSSLEVASCSICLSTRVGTVPTSHVYGCVSANAVGRRKWLSKI
jgi:hypothetical protein